MTQARPTDSVGPPDEELVRRCHTELPYRTQAFEQLVRRHESRLFSVCRRYLGHAEEAEEAVQDVLMRVFHGLPKFQLQSTFRTWVYRITMNVCASRYARLRELARRREQVHEELEREELERADQGSGLESIPGAEDLGGLTGRALEDLGEADRKALVLRHVGELSLEELAEALELKLSAAKMRLYRAEERFREAYGRARSKSSEKTQPV